MSAVAALKTARLVIPYRTYVLPWDGSLDEEQRFRAIGKQVGIATILFCLLMSVLPLPERDPTVNVPVPPRLARLLLEKPAPLPPPPPVVAPDKPEPVVEQPTEQVARVEKPVALPVKPEPDRKNAVREKAAKAGLLPFADQLADLRDHQSLTSIAAGGTNYTGAVGDSPRQSTT